MIFPDWVPAGACEYVKWTLEGDKGGPWKGIGAEIAALRTKTGQKDRLAELESRAECMNRLATDHRMGDVYNQLEKVLTNNEQYRQFLHAAWMAKYDYGACRDSVKNAKALAPKIAETARELARLLDSAQRVGIVPPDEFFSILSLLESTESSNTWHAVRPLITGQPDAENYPDAQARRKLSYAWEKAPFLPAILDTVARAADDWNPRITGSIGAAISSRKRNTRTEYIRAFGNMLCKQKFSLPPLFAVMAETANVVLNDPDIVISTDDVRKAFLKAPMEDSA